MYNHFLHPEMTDCVNLLQNTVYILKYAYSSSQNPYLCSKVDRARAKAWRQVIVLGSKSITKVPLATFPNSMGVVLVMDPAAADDSILDGGW